MIAGLRSDKDALETALYEQQQVNSNLETRKEQLEGENQELIVKKESLQSKVLEPFHMIVYTYVSTPYLQLINTKIIEITLACNRGSVAMLKEL